MRFTVAEMDGLNQSCRFHTDHDKLVFAYSMAGLFVGYVYFSIPRTILTIMAAAEKLKAAGVTAMQGHGRLLHFAAGRWDDAEKCYLKAIEGSEQLVKEFEGPCRYRPQYESKAYATRYARGAAGH